MFMVSSRMANPGNSPSMASAADTVLLLARTDLFAECLVEALGRKFPLCDIVSTTDTERIAQQAKGAVRLSLMYKIPPAELYESVQMLRQQHPSTAIALVIDPAEMTDSRLDMLVRTRMIDGVLPLNLRMDVFMAVVDLLMKGGEHFPSALMGRLRTAPPPLADTGKALAMSNAELAISRQSETYPLTTREIQILDLLCKGTQNKIIAERLHLSENTVKAHVRNIYKKMNVRNRTEAASRFFQTEASDDPPSGLRN